MKKILISILAYLLLASTSAFADANCDFDGDGMSEFVIINVGTSGNYDWQTFNPRNQSSSTLINNFGNASSKLIPGNWIDSNHAIPAIVDPVTGGPTGRAQWTARSDDRYSGTSYSLTRSLGRPGDIIILGGDYDGNGITDSLILKRTTGMLGLRINYFLSNYNGNNLGKERLYKALGRPFIDRNFFFSPDGYSDYLGVFRKTPGSASKILTLKPFTDTPHAITLGYIPNDAQGPYALKQKNGKPDLLLFYSQKNNSTSLIIKNLSGTTINSKQLKGSGLVLVGNYLPDPGYEVAVQGSTGIEIYNPNSKKNVSVIPPSGLLISCVGSQIIQ